MGDTCRVVALDEIKGHFPSGTTFEDYWPAKGSIEPVNHSQRVSAGNWTQKPVSVAPQNHANAQHGVPAQNNSAQRIPTATHSRQNYSSQQQTQQQSAAMTSYAQQLNTVAAAAAAQRNYASTYEMLQRAQMGQAQAAAMTAAAVRQQQQMLAAAYAGLPGNHSTMQAAQQAAAQAAQQPQSQQSRSSQQSQHQSSSNNDKAFNGKLTQIKEFPMEQSHQPPYKLQKALIDQKIVPCINVRPYVFHDLMMT